jgi:ATP-binding cassette subfamily C protein CydC
MTNLWAILKVVANQWRWLAAGVLLSLVVIAANSLLMALSGWFIASMAVAGAAKLTFNYFVPSAAIRALAISRTVGRYLERLVTHSAAFRSLLLLRVWLFEKVAPLSPALLQKYSSGELAGRLRADIDSLENLYLRILLPIATALFSTLFATLFVFTWSRNSAAALLTGFAVACLLLPYIARKMALPHSARAAALTKELRSSVVDGLSGGAELILLRAVDRFAGETERISAGLVESQRKLADGGACTSALMLLVTGGVPVAVLLLAGGEVARGLLTGPELVMLLLFCAAAFEGVAALPLALQLVPYSEAAAARVIELAEAPLPVPEPLQPLQMPAGSAIEFKGVRFSHHEAMPLLDDFNLAIKEGERVALTGESGAGKSSVAELLLRFRSYQGSITLGGVELADLDSGEVRRRITAVQQQPHIFNGTVRDNITLAKPEASDGEIAAALHDSVLDVWVAGLPDGLQTRTGEGGAAISGGEARRIAIARALLKDAPIVILDEPTEGLDPVAEALLLERLSVRLQGKTLLLITHSKAPLAIVDKIVQLGA